MIGGSCINVTRIPAKTMVRSAKVAKPSRQTPSLVSMHGSQLIRLVWVNGSAQL